LLTKEADRNKKEQDLDALCSINAHLALHRNLTSNPKKLPLFIVLPPSNKGYLRFTGEMTVNVD
jgi:hypothetical protein